MGRGEGWIQSGRLLQFLNGLDVPSLFFEQLPKPEMRHWEARIDIDGLS